MSATKHRLGRWALRGVTPAWLLSLVPHVMIPAEGKRIDRRYRNLRDTS